MDMDKTHLSFSHSGLYFQYTESNEMVQLECINALKHLSHPTAPEIFSIHRDFMEEKLIQKKILDNRKPKTIALVEYYITF